MEDPMTSQRRLATRGIIFKDGKLLCQQLKPGQDGKIKDYWCTPGGGLDMGESIKAGLHREMIEETGIAPVIGKLLFVQQFSEDGVKEQMEFFFHIENAKDYEVIDLSATTHGELEIGHVDFVDPKTHNVLPAFLQTIDIQAHIDSGDPVHVYFEAR
jgi:ADP-ribose pyrophosphatase YjhB (NUDIX family)